MRFVLFTFCLHFLLRRHVYFFSDLVPWLSFSKFLSSPAPPFSSTSTRFFLVCSRTLVMSFFLRYTSSDSLFSNFSLSNFFRKKFACCRRDGSINTLPRQKNHHPSSKESKNCCKNNCVLIPPPWFLNGPKSMV